MEPTPSYQRGLVTGGRGIPDVSYNAGAGRPRLTQPQIYAAGPSLADITEGPDNGFCPDVCSVRPGYDFVTGLGSPRAGLDAVLAAVR